jgi:2-haloalkanoic acid dehalogenase type II
MITTLIFDVYGTLLDTRKCSLAVLEDVIEKRRCSLSSQIVYQKWREKIEEIILKMDSEIKFKSEKEFFKAAMDNAFDELEINASAEQKMKAYNEMCWGKRFLFPETKDAIENLREDFTVIIASNSDTEPLLIDLDKHELQVDKVFSSEKLKFYKPHQEFYQRLLKKIGKNPDECVYIGDSLKNDVLMPKKAGMKSIWINRNNEKIENNVKPDLVVNNLLEIEQNLSKI